MPLWPIALLIAFARNPLRPESNCACDHGAILARLPTAWIDWCHAQSGLLPAAGLTTRFDSPICFCIPAHSRASTGGSFWWSGERRLRVRLHHPDTPRRDVTALE
jgi:hypothetical protein